jgi:hypothetical protein
MMNTNDPRVSPETAAKISRDLKWLLVFIVVWPVLVISLVVICATC